MQGMPTEGVAFLYDNAHLQIALSWAIALQGVGASSVLFSSGPCGKSCVWSTPRRFVRTPFLPVFQQVKKEKLVWLVSQLKPFFLEAYRNLKPSGQNASKKRVVVWKIVLLYRFK
jgi:hypothetical protein